MAFEDEGGVIKCMSSNPSDQGYKQLRFSARFRQKNCNKWKVIYA